MACELLVVGIAFRKMKILLLSNRLGHSRNWNCRARFMVSVFISGMGKHIELSTNRLMLTCDPKRAGRDQR